MDFFFLSCQYHWLNKPAFSYLHYQGLKYAPSHLCQMLELLLSLRSIINLYNVNPSRSKVLCNLFLWQVNVTFADLCLISKAIESSVYALVSWTNTLTDTTNTLTDMHELLTNWLTPLTDTTNVLRDTDELLTNCLTPLLIFIESSNGWLPDS